MTSPVITVKYLKGTKMGSRPQNVLGSRKGGGLDWPERDPTQEDRQEKGNVRELAAKRRIAWLCREAIAQGLLVLCRGRA